MPRLQMDLDTDIAPEVLRAALIDFGPDRPAIWPGIHPPLYEVRAVGDTWTDAREGSKVPGGDIWAVEHYDWSDPNTVTITVRESNFSAPGSNVRVTITPSPPGGSHVRIEWQRTGIGIKGKLMIGLMALTRGKLIARSFQQGTDAIRQRGYTGPTTA